MRISPQFVLSVALGFVMGFTIGRCVEARAQVTSPVPPRYDEHLTCDKDGCARYGIAIDGDSVKLSTRTVRLYGIDAPELTQRCDGIEVGKQAQRHLQDLIRGGLSCIEKGTDRYGRSLVICTNKQGVEVNRQMVIDGMAFPYLKYSQRYADVPKQGPIYAFKCSNPEDIRRKR